MNDEELWHGACEVAAYAPNTGFVPLRSSTVLAVRCELEHLRAHLRAVLSVVNEQAEDEALWTPAATIVEAYLQQALRRLHEACEKGSS